MKRSGDHHQGADHKAPKYAAAGDRAPLLLAAAPTALPAELALSFDEAGLGIAAYMRTGGTPFSGIVKSRFCDFVVHEIDAQNRVVQLTSTAVPAEELAAEAAKRAANAAAAQAPALDASVGLAAVVALAGDEVGAAFAAWFHGVLGAEAAAAAASEADGGNANAAAANSTAAAAASSPLPASFAFPASFDKAQRTATHMLFKQHLPMLSSDFQNGCVSVRFLRYVRAFWPLPNIFSFRYF